MLLPFRTFRQLSAAPIGTSGSGPSHRTECQKLEADLAEAEARLEVNPDDVDALMMRGAVLIAQDHDEEAIRVLLRRRSLTRGEDGPDQLLAYVLNRRARSLLYAGPGSGSTEEPVDLARQSRRAFATSSRLCEHARHRTLPRRTRRRGLALPGRQPRTRTTARPTRRTSISWRSLTTGWATRNRRERCSPAP